MYTMLLKVMDKIEHNSEESTLASNNNFNHRPDSTPALEIKSENMKIILAERLKTIVPISSN